MVKSKTVKKMDDWIGNYYKTVGFQTTFILKLLIMETDSWNHFFWIKISERFLVIQSLDNSAKFVYP